MALFNQINPDPLRPPTMEEIQRARSMYAEGFTVARCLAAGNMSHGTLYYWLDGGPLGADGTPLLPPIARRRVVAGKRRRAVRSDLGSLAARLYGTAERAARDIEERLKRPEGSAAERERNVRMLASITSSLRSLAALTPAGEAGTGGSEEGAHAADVARYRAAREALWRELEHHVGFLGDLWKAVRNIQKGQASVDRQAREQQAAEDNAAEFREVFARRIEAFAEARKQRDGE